MGPVFILKCPVAQSLTVQSDSKFLSAEFLKSHADFSIDPIWRDVATCSGAGVALPAATSRRASRHNESAYDKARNVLKLRLMKLLTLFCPEFRGHQSIATASKRAQAMIPITPQEFLF